MYHPEPASFYRLDVHSSSRLRQDSRDRIYSKIREENMDARDLINAKIFGGRLHWVNLQHVPLLSEKLGRDSPFAKDKVYRQLPVQIPRKGDIPLNVYITDHGITPASSEKVRGTVLEGRPYYKVWAIPETVKEGSEELHYLGIGYLDKVHNTAVDQRVDPLLDELVGWLSTGVLSQ